MKYDTEQPMAHVDKAILMLHDAGAHQEAWLLLVERYHMPISTYCKSMLYSLDDGLDAAQETLLAACEGLGGFQRRSSLRTWLLGIARRQCYKVLQKRRVRQRSYHEQADIARQAHLEPPRGLSESSEDEWIRHMLECLDRLGKEERNRIILRYFNGLSAADIAEIEGVSERQMQRLLRLAVNRLEEFVNHDR